MATEMGHIADTVSSMALGYAHVHITLHHNGRVVKNWARASQPRERVMDVLGKDLKNKLFRVEHENSHVMVNGWVGSPEATRATPRNIYVYINKRIVKDRVIQHALYEGYAGRIMKGQYPLAVLFLEVPHDTLDVNVHPTKNEVRFARQKEVHDTVKQAVSEALKQGDAIKWGGGYRPDVQAASVVSERSRPFQNTVTDVTPGPAVFSRNRWDSASEPVTEKHGQNDNRLSMKPPTLFQAPETTVSQPGLWDKTRFVDLKVIGQFHDVYIVCEAGQDLVMIDQHAAHERIMYEHLKKHRGERVESQSLLMPETIDFGYREAGVLEKMMPELAKIGFQIEHFGGATYVVASAPALLKTSDVKPLVIELVEKWIEHGLDSITDRAMDDTLKIMACHAAVRANQRLTDLEIKTMLEQLDACDQPSNCPHGRPIWIKLERRYIEKLFKRVV